MASPIILQSKLIYQFVRKDKLDWDPLLPDNFRKECYSFCEKLHQLKRIQVLLPLCKTYDTECPYEIHDLHMHQEKHMVV